MKSLTVLLKNTEFGKFLIRINNERIRHKREKYHNGEVAKMRRYGLEALKKFDECLTANGYVYTLATGTLLGAVREKGFIPHDEDIDVFMWSEDYDERLYKLLEKMGFVRQHSFFVDNAKYGREDSFLYKGVQLDIFYVYPPFENETVPYFTAFFCFPDTKNQTESISRHGGLMPMRLLLPITKEIVRVQFENISLPIPKNADDVLIFRYGKDYMIPNPNWKAADANIYNIPWPEKVGVLEEY